MKPLGNLGYCPGRMAQEFIYRSHPDARFTRVAADYKGANNSKELLDRFRSVKVAEDTFAPRLMVLHAPGLGVGGLFLCDGGVGLLRLPQASTAESPVIRVELRMGSAHRLRAFRASSNGKRATGACKSGRLNSHLVFRTAFPDRLNGWRPKTMVS